MGIMDTEPTAPATDAPRRGRPPGAKTRSHHAQPAPIVAPVAPAAPAAPPYIKPTAEAVAKVKAECCVGIKGALSGASALTHDPRWETLACLPTPEAGVVDAWVSNAIDLCVHYELPMDGPVMAWLGLGSATVAAVLLFRSLPAPSAEKANGATVHPLHPAAPAAQ